MTSPSRFGWSDHRNYRDTLTGLSNETETARSGMLQRSIYIIGGPNSIVTIHVTQFKLMEDYKLQCVISSQFWGVEGG